MDQRLQRQRPSSSPSPQSSRKVFNCIVDDTALVAGVKRSTRNGLRQWIKNGQIRLFVPLHALEQLSSQKNGSARHAEDVRETLDWLDQATTRYPNSVTLQGGDETFQQWSEVQKFVVPRSLFSEYDRDTETTSAEQENDTGASPESPMLAHRSAISILPSPPSSPSRKSHDQSLEAGGDQGEVPIWLQPLFNYILWRIHQEIDPAAALESFIFLCNDPAKANLAKGFEVRCKRLEQLRDAIGREDRDFKNRQVVQHRSTQSVSSIPDEQASPPPRSPPVGPASMSNPSVVDPDTFDRSPKAQISTGQQHVRGNDNTRGRGSLRGRGRGAGMSSPVLGRATLVVGAGRRRVEDFEDSGPQIDPNSFERPRGGYVGRGGRRLWTPG